MLKILIAEDDLMIGDLLQLVLTASGYQVCGIARTVEEGVILGELHALDLAVLDVQLLRGELGSEIARRLHSKGKFGVLYATGNSPQTSTLTCADGEAVITKPYRPEDLLRALEIVRELSIGGIAAQPFPPGFRLLQETPALAQTAA